MKILNIHNHHVLPGGMEVVFSSLTKLLRDRGHTVIEVSKHNAQLDSLWKKLSAFGGAIHSPTVYREMSELLEREKPDVAHVHNLYPQFSTSAIDAMHDAGVPVFLHAGDYKLTCPTAQHLRDGKICEKCLGGREYNAVLHNCRGNFAMSAAYAARNAWARGSGRIKRGVSVYLCPTKFVADLLIRGGFPADRVKVVSNYCDLPDVPPRETPGEYIAYIGRISPEKGLDVLIDAARLSGLATKIAGNPAPMPHLLNNLPPNVEFVGQLDRAAITKFLDGTKALVVPSVWWEVFGLVCVEALSRGIPVIASDIGGLPEVITHEQTGLLVPPNDPAALAAAMKRLWDEPAYAKQLGHRGYVDARERFTIDTFYKTMQSIWGEVLASSPDAPSAAPHAATHFEESVADEDNLRVTS